jgi:hypothetical protein
MSHTHPYIFDLKFAAAEARQPSSGDIIACPYILSSTLKTPLEKAQKAAFSLKPFEKYSKKSLFSNQPQR